jgi:hypothetical protein
MNIQKKLFFLMALYYSFGVTTSAVDSLVNTEMENQSFGSTTSAVDNLATIDPEDRIFEIRSDQHTAMDPEDRIFATTPPNVQSLEDLKESATITATKIYTLLSKLHMNGSSFGLYVKSMREFDSLCKEFQSIIRYIHQGLRDKANDDSLSLKDKLSTKEEFELILDAADKVQIRVLDRIKGVLNNIDAFPDKSYDSKIRRYLIGAKQDHRIGKFLDKLLNNKVDHELKLKKHEQHAKNITDAKYNDSDQETEESSINAKIRTEKDIIARRSQLIKYTVEQFNNVKEDIAHDVSIFVARSHRS